MKILAIAIYQPSKNKIIHSAPFSSRWFFKGALANEISQCLSTIPVHLLNDAEIFYQKLTTNSLYAKQIKPDQIAIGLFNHETSLSFAASVFKKLTVNPHQNLISLMNDVNRFDQKIETLNENLEELKKILLCDIEKLLIRGEKLEELEKKTKVIQEQAQLFRQKCEELNGSRYCGMYGFYKRAYHSVHEYFYPQPKTHAKRSEGVALLNYKPK